MVLDVFEGNRVRQTVEQLSDLFLGAGLGGRIDLHEQILARSAADSFPPGTTTPSFTNTCSSWPTCSVYTLTYSLVFSSVYSSVYSFGSSSPSRSSSASGAGWLRGSGPVENHLRRSRRLIRRRGAHTIEPRGV